MSESTTIALRVQPSEIAKIESIAAQCALQALNAQGHFQRAFTMAAGIRLLKQTITKDMMADLMDLQGTKLGFRTDKDRDGGYPLDVVRDCAIEAALRGALWVGNEFNIIAGNCYLTKEFFTRVLAEFPGLTDLKLFPGVPQMAGDRGALVPFSATWVFQGKPDRIDRNLTKLADGTQLDERICVRVNSGMGADAILGKAERKIRAAIYGRITGTVVTDGEVDDGVPRKPVQTLDQLAGNLEGKVATPAEQFAACTTKEAVIELHVKLCNAASTNEEAAGYDALRDEAYARLSAKGGKQKELVK